MLRASSTNVVPGSHARAHSRAPHGLVAGLLLASAFLAPLARAQTGTIQRVNLDGSGAEANFAAGITSISVDGRFVAFTTSATNLIASDANGYDDVYLRDTWLGTIERVSEASGGADGNGPSSYPSISADGRYVVFSSWATNLVPNDTNGTNDVFLRDRALQVTTRLSVDANGVEGNSNSFLGAISSNGRYATFVSFATNLVPGDTNQARDVFLCDLVAGTIERVSLGDTGQEADGSSGGNAVAAFVSDDGRFVAFTSAATNLVPGDTNFVDDVYLRDRVLGTTTRLSRGVGGAEPDDACEVTAFTPDGAHVAFASAASNLVSGDTNGTTDGFVLTLATGALERVTVATGGAQGSQSSWNVWLSRDGRFAAFLSTSPDLVANDVNGKRDVFLRDRAAGSTELASVSDGGVQGIADSFGLSMSGDGSALSFSSSSDNLVANDTNAVADAFQREMRAGSPYCAGTVATCPCGNAGLGRGGCANSTGATGWLDLRGSARLGFDTATLVATGLPPGTSAMFLDGGTPPFGGAGAPFGDGLRCVGAPVRFLGLRHAPDGSARFGFEGTDPLLSVVSTVPAAGDYRRYQVWYRDAAPFCTGATYDLTNAIEVLWLP